MNQDLLTVGFGLRLKMYMIGWVGLSASVIGLMRCLRYDDMFSLIILGDLPTLSLLKEKW